MGLEGEKLDLLEQWLEQGGLATLDRFTSAASDVIGVMDREYLIRYVNATAPGLSRESVVGQSAFVMIPPTEAVVAREAFDLALAGTPSRFEIIYKNEVGLIVFVVRVHPIFHEGKVIGAFTINMDATEERRENMDRDRFFSLSLDMLVVVTPEGVLRRINPALAEALGCVVDEIVGRQFLDFVHPDDVERTRQAYGEVIEGKSVHDFENRYRRSDGAYRVFSWRATVDPVTGDVYAVARDVSDHRTTEIELRHAQKMEAVGQLAGGIAHDFNNLMQAVLANVEVALSEDATREEIIDHLHEIQAAGERAADLTKQLLVFSRRRPLDRQAIDINDSIHGLIKLLRRLLPENITVEVRRGESLPSVSADRTQLEQVIVNLCVNARDAMEVGGKLTLETTDVVLTAADCEIHPWAKPGHFVCLSVTDTGVGMTPEVRDRIFDPFFTTKSHRSGTGLGLSTLYGIVQQHGGFVHVYSEVGLGTTFKVYLPAARGSSTSLPKEPKAPQALGGTETILVAEDEEVVRKPVVQILEGAGYRTLSAKNGREAVELLRDHLQSIDLVILDVVMPVLGGPEAWQEMRRLRPDVRVIFTSGYADERYRERLPEGVEVLDKPFRTERFLRQVRMVLDS